MNASDFGDNIKTRHCKTNESLDWTRFMTIL